MLVPSDQHNKVLHEQPLIALRRASNLKDNHVDSVVKGRFCGCSLWCEECKFMSEEDKFACHGAGKEYNINHRFDRDSSGVWFIC